MKTLPFEKEKGDVFIGFLASECDPPTTLDLLVAMQCMPACLLDKLVYAVIDPLGADDYFHKTRKHRIAMAELAISMMRPLLESARLGDGHPMSSEETAFELFRLNPSMKFTLFHVSLANDVAGRLESVKRLVSNIGTKLHGFESSRHRVVALFVDETPAIDAPEAARRLISNGVLAVHYIERKEPELLTRAEVDQRLFDVLNGDDEVQSSLLFSSVAEYISSHPEYRRMLAARLAARLVP